MIVLVMKNHLIILLVIVFFCLFGAQQASAHATPISYEPEASSLLEKMPQQVRIYFSERIEQGASGIIVYGPDGSRVDNDDAVIDSRNARFYGLHMRDGGQGTYTVSWQVVSSDDGHFTKGAFSFSVGKETKKAFRSSLLNVR